MIWECIVGFHAIVDGKEIAKREKCVIDGKDTFSETESCLRTLFEHLAELEILAIKKSKIKEIANYKNYDDERIYEATLRDVFINDDGVEKPISYKILLCAKDFDKAKDFISEYIKQGYDMSLVNLKETSFVDIYL